MAAGADSRRAPDRRFPRQEQAKDLLRFTSAGSVDDGKSTLIGRLLYDSRSVYDDQIPAGGALRRPAPPAPSILRC